MTDREEVQMALAKHLAEFSATLISIPKSLYFENESFQAAISQRALDIMARLEQEGFEIMRKE